MSVLADPEEDQVEEGLLPPPFGHEPAEGGFIAARRFRDRPLPARGTEVLPRDGEAGEKRLPGEAQVALGMAGGDEPLVGEENPRRRPGETGAGSEKPEEGDGRLAAGEGDGKGSRPRRFLPDGEGEIGEGVFVWKNADLRRGPARIF